MLFWSIAGVIAAFALLLFAHPLLFSSKKALPSEVARKTEASADEMSDEAGEHRGIAGRSRKHPLFALILMIIVLTGSVLTYINYSNGYQNMLAMQEVDKVVSGLLDLIDELEESLVENPDVYEDWRLLARMRKSLQQYDEAAVAYAELERLNKLYEVEDLRDYAESLVMGNQSLEKARQLLDRILSLDAEDYAALYLYGMLEFKSENYPGAIEQWQVLYDSMEGEEPRWRDEVQAMIREAQSKVEGKVAPAPKETVVLLKANVSIKSELDDKIAADDVVFVYIKAIDGPKAPLAVKRLSADDLKEKISFSDADAMVPSLLPSAFEKVEVIALVSKTGTAQRQPGDLVGVSKEIVWKQEPVEVSITIDEVVK